MTIVRTGALAIASLCMVLGSCSADGEPTKSRGNGTGSFAGAPSNANPSGLVTPTNPGVVNAGGANGCQPGHYVGVFTGMYNSAAWGNGSLPLTIAAVPSLGRPGLEFWLEKSGGECKSGVEFCPEFTVKGGKIRGFADPFSDGTANSSGGFAIAVRFEIDFGGELDCSRGQFRGLLQNGCYDVATLLFRFEGTAPAMYDQQTSSFTNGQWTVKEMAMPGVLFPPDANIGGGGVWQASLMKDNSAPVDASAGLCHM